MPKDRHAYDEYYDGELPPPNRKRTGMHPTVQAAIVAAIAAIVVAIIGAIPVGSSERPLACSFDANIFNGIYNCNGTMMISGQPSPTPNIVETSVAQTLTAIAPTPDDASTSVSETLTAIADVTLSATSPTPTSTTLVTNTPIPPTDTNIPTHLPLSTSAPTQPMEILTAQQNSESDCFCTIYTVPDDRYSGCPGIVIEAGYEIPPSSILQPNANASEIWVYFSEAQAPSGGVLWRYRTEMYGGGTYASEACVKDQYQYFRQRRPVEFP